VSPENWGGMDGGQIAITVISYGIKQVWSKGSETESTMQIQTNTDAYTLCDCNIT